MIPVSNLHVNQFSIEPSDWLVYKLFSDGDRIITIRGFGRTRQEALDDYERELEECPYTVTT